MNRHQGGNSENLNQKHSDLVCSCLEALSESLSALENQQLELNSNFKTSQPSSKWARSTGREIESLDFEDQLGEKNKKSEQASNKKWLNSLKSLSKSLRLKCKFLFSESQIHSQSTGSSKRFRTSFVLRLKTFNCSPMCYTRSDHSDRWDNLTERLSSSRNYEETNSKV